MVDASSCSSSSLSERQPIGQLVSKGDLDIICKSFPTPLHSFGYGSGVFHQQRVDEGEEVQSQIDAALPMLDLIFVVENAERWHDANMRLCASHYSLMPKLLGPGFVRTLQKMGDGKVYFNPLVSIDVPVNTEIGSEIFKQRTREVKYGVIEKEDLLDDLLNWRYLYIAGRLHKPTVLVDYDAQVTEAQNKNLRAALAASLLINGNAAATNKDNSDQSLISIFETLANLSYSGDPRMSVGGEDPNKVTKLVQSPGQLERWKNLYKDSFQELYEQGIVSIDWDVDCIHFSWDKTMSAYRELSTRLPKPVATLLENNLKRNSSECYSATLSTILASTVASAARHQTIKGLITAGIFKSLRYAGAKFSKGLFKR